MENSHILITALVSMGSTLLGGLIALFANWITKRSEEKKHLQRLMLEAAITEWNRSFDIAKAYSRAGKSVQMLPFDIYLLRHARLIELFLDDDASEENLTKKLDEIDRVMQTAISWYKTKDKK